MDKGHGRLEKRILRTTSLLTLLGKWKGMKQGFELWYERTVKGKRSVEKADAAPLLKLMRDHRQIENHFRSGVMKVFRNRH